ncbi:PaREP1 family protein [Vulcanisaeta thermophila]|uniref:PaREP1 family protein n=1 Tax=Vulcanisaeta thermophila TaxID=867917 RepID=UPI000852E35E|nr:PaREP1 family protein [Vulcanisaeta thermophila]
MGLLGKAVKSLEKYYGETIAQAWEVAYERLHVEGFHEGRLSVGDVKRYMSIIYQILQIVSEVQGS